MIFSNLKFCCKPCTTTREEGQYQNADFVFKKMRTSCLKKCGLWHWSAFLYRVEIEGEVPKCCQIEKIKILKKMLPFR